MDLGLDLEEEDEFLTFKQQTAKQPGQDHSPPKHNPPSTDNTSKMRQQGKSPTTRVAGGNSPGARSPSGGAGTATFDWGGFDQVSLPLLSLTPTLLVDVALTQHLL
jgi:hypothetical protein